MRLFRIYVLENCFEKLYVVLARFKKATGVSLSEQTGRRYIHKLQMQSYIAIQNSYLGKNNLSARIIWAHTHVQCKREKWSKFMFTDESSFSVHPIKNGYEYSSIEGDAMNRITLPQPLSQCGPHRARSIATYL